jgi:TonB-linked SusC/RagA family outer membrane protein
MSMKYEYSSKRSKDNRLNFIFGLFAFFFFVASPMLSFAQNAKVNVSVENASLKQLFASIEKQTKYTFSYRDAEISGKDEVTLTARRQTVASILRDVLPSRRLQYTMVGNKILITPRQEKTVIRQEAPKNKVTGRVKGTVFESDGQPLIGATVREEGTNVGTTTDVNGAFSLPVDKEYTNIVISYIGKKDARYRLKVGGSMKATLADDVQNLNDVVVTGYQTISKERATGSFAKVTSEQLEKKRYSNLSTMLEGEVAGYNASSNLIRGTTTMNGVTNPLYVIDGFPIESTRYDQYGGLEESVPNINLEDIESITVLKDAAAASIYGARAANGVVVIVTKKAKQNKISVSFSSDFTLHPYYFYKDRLANSATMVDIEREWASSNPNLQGDNVVAYAQSMLENNAYTSQGVKALLNYYAGNTTQNVADATLQKLAAQGYRYFDDVAKYAKRDALYQQYNLTFGKASPQNNFMGSVSYRNNKFNDKFTKDDSFGFDLKNSLDMTSWLKFDIGSYTYFKKGTTQTYDAMNPGYSYMPYDGLVNDDGSYYTSTPASRYSQSTVDIINSNSLYSMNITPLDEIGRNLKDTHNFVNRTYGKLGITFNSHLKYDLIYQYEYATDKSKLLYEKDSYHVRNLVNSFATAGDNGTTYNIPYGNIYFRENQTSKAYTFRQQLNYNQTFDQKHNVTVLIGHEVRQTKLEYDNSTLYNYDPEMLSFSMVDASVLTGVYGLLGGSNFSQSNIAYNRYTDDRFISFYGNAAYSYDDKYMATGSIRWDRSNLWGTSSKYQKKPIWSVGAGWNIDRESFFNVPWVNRLKLRFSYGIGGNIAKNAAPYMTAYYSQNNNIGDIQGSISGRPNPTLRWEKTTTTNIGLDFAFFKNRVNGSIEYYNKMGTDLLANTMGVPTEGYGYSTYMINNGKMRNRGVELTLDANILHNKDFDLNAMFTYSYNKNKVTYVNVKAPYYVLQLDYPQAYPVVGNPFSAVYAYKWAGLSDKGLPQIYDADGNVTANNPYDLNAIAYAGTTEPTTNASLNLSLRYKSLDFSCLWIYRGGHKLRNTDLPMLPSAWNGTLYSYVTSLAPVNSGIVNRWKQAGDEKTTNVPRALFAENPDYNSESYSLYSYADINVIDATSLRLANISLSYHLPAQWLHKVFLSNAKLQFNVENVLTIAKSKAAKYMLGGYTAPNYVWGLSFDF